MLYWYGLLIDSDTESVGKPTHANLYLYRDSHHHPADNESWLP